MNLGQFKGTGLGRVLPLPPICLSLVYFFYVSSGLNLLSSVFLILLCCFTTRAEALTPKWYSYSSLNWPELSFFPVPFLIFVSLLGRAPINELNSSSAFIYGPIPIRPLWASAHAHTAPPYFSICSVYEMDLLGWASHSCFLYHFYCFMSFFSTPCKRA